MQSGETKQSFCFVHIFLGLTHRSDFSGNKIQLQALLTQCLVALSCNETCRSNSVLFLALIFAGHLV